MCAILLCVLPLAGAADPPKEDVVKAHQEKLQGTWKFVSIELDGKVNAPKQELPDFNLVVTGTNFRFGKREGELVINPTLTPHAIDLRYKNEGTVVGIYRFDGDTLTLCLRRGNGEAKDRPGAFKTDKEMEYEIRLYKREKPKK